MGFDQIPAELRKTHSWVTWRLEDINGRRTKVPYNPVTRMKASSVDMSTWVSFDRARDAIFQEPELWSGIGFMLSEADPFAVIDLDDPSKIEIEAERQREFATIRWVYESCPQSYVERSPSGTGAHIWLMCEPTDLDKGVRRGKVEVYRTHRFMTVTGNIIRPLPIANGSEFIRTLAATLGQTTAVSLASEMDVEAEAMTDHEVIAICEGYANGQKFMDLMDGSWEQHYSSQSEADFALINMLQFVTKTRSQIKRIFRSSQLGQRAKANRDQYLDKMIARSFDQELPPIDISALRNELIQSQAPVEEVMTVPLPEVTFGTQSPDDRSLSFPPGLVGEIARYVYASAPRPVPEIAVAAALGLMSGICGRAFSVNGSGLNLYIILLAATGTGKESINSGINRLMRAVADAANDEALMNFIGPSSFASSQGLHTQLEKNPSFVSVLGEMGLMLQSMTGPGTNENKLMLRKMILDLYSKSDPGQTLQGVAYSKEQDNKKALTSPAMTIIGESTPERFYEALTEELVSEGLMPRFTIIEYKGLRPQRNKSHHMSKPSPDLVAAIADLAVNSAFWNKHNENVECDMTDEAMDILDAFDQECDDAINAGIERMASGESAREILMQLWNRGHLKALRLSGVISCGMPYKNGRPMITAEIANWAVDLVRKDIVAMNKRFEDGEVGTSNLTDMEGHQLRKLTDCISRIIDPAHPMSLSAMNSYGLSAKMINDLVIPYSAMHRMVASSSQFKKDKRGASMALKRTIDILIERGDLRLVNRQDAITMYHTNGLCYNVARIKTFLRPQPTAIRLEEELE